MKIRFADEGRRGGLPKWLGALIVLITAASVAGAATEVGSFTSPLSATLGGTGVVSPTAHGVLVGEGASAVAALTVGTNGQVLVGSGGADPVFATVGTGTGISTTTGAGTLTINNTGVTSIIAGSGISRDVATGAVTITNSLTTATVTAKTADYSVLSGDTATMFTNVGASGTVIFTLPTAASGLQYTFYVDAVQTLEILAGASTTIQVGGTTSASAGNITNAVKGGSIKLIGISSTKWVCIGMTGTWTVN